MPGQRAMTAAGPRPRARPVPRPGQANVAKASRG